MIGDLEWCNQCHGVFVVEDADTDYSTEAGRAVEFRWVALACGHTKSTRTGRSYVP